MKLRRIVVLTANELKFKEFEREFENYGIQAVMRPVTNELPLIEGYLREQSDEFWVKAVIREQMHLRQAIAEDHYVTLSEDQNNPIALGMGVMGENEETGESEPKRVKKNEPSPWLGQPGNWASMKDLELVVVQSHMYVWMLSKDEQARMREAKYEMALTLKHPGAEAREPEGGPGPAGQLEVKTFTSRLDGVIDLSKRSAAPDVFGWDDIMVIRGTNMTFQEIKQLGLHKISPRDQNISSYIQQHIYYQKRRDLKWNPKAARDTIKFEGDASVADFVTKNRFMTNEIAQKTGITDIFLSVANNGAFFRAAKNRREANYWLPGLNAGIPYVPKRDPVHEITFMAHDFGHFFIPDLVFTGHASANARRTYIIYRMMSEATTLVFADMLFVDTLARSGHAYDYAKRRIYPLYQDTGVRPFDALADGGSNKEAFLASFRRLLECNVAYCLLGDDSKYKELIRENGQLREDGSCDSLENFKDKYMPFFVEDYKWTSANWRNMAGRAEEFRRWWEMVAPLREAAGLSSMSNGVGLETVEDHMAAIGVAHDTEISSPDLIQKVFEQVFDTRIRPVFNQGFRLEPEKVRLRNAFSRYLMGQMIVFARFSFLPETPYYVGRIINYMQEHIGDLDTEKIETVRKFYDSFLDTLVDKSLISLDDRFTFHGVCPLFEPVFVFYDENKDFYTELSEIQKEMLA